MQVYRSGDGGFACGCRSGTRHEVHGLRSAGFRDWLIDGYFIERQEPPSTAAIMRVVSLLEARARFDGGTPPVFVRVGQGGDPSGSSYFLDLGDSSGAAIKIALLRVGCGCPAGDPIEAAGGAVAATCTVPWGLDRTPAGGYVNVTEEGFRLLNAWLTARGA